MIQRSSIISNARSWLGTPFAHQGRARGRGVDCAGLVIVVGRELGLFAPDFDCTGYGREPHLGLLPSLMDAHMDLLESRAAAEPGDVLLMTFLREPQHCGILTDTGTLIHAFAGVGRVVEHGIDLKWARRVVAAYRYRGVAPWQM